MPDKKVIRDSLELIEKHILEKLSVEELAESVGFSRYHYQRLFADIMGESVMRYVRKRKITLAAAELLENRSTVLDIALKYGYGSHESFTRAFKAQMGIAPAQFRGKGRVTALENEEKECTGMGYESSMAELTKQIHEFINIAEETVEFANREGLPGYRDFWDFIGGKTREFAEELSAALTQLEVFSENPDRIESRFTVLKLVEDAAFFARLTALNAGLFVARGNPEDAEKQQPVCERFDLLAKASSVRKEKITELLRELAGLIFADMRRKRQEVKKEILDTAAGVLENIGGYSYIREEVKAMIHELTELDEDRFTSAVLEGFLFRLKIISYSAGIDALRHPEASVLPELLGRFSECLERAAEELSDLVLSEQEEGMKRSTEKYFEDMAFHGNVLLFYWRGEISEEKLGRLLKEEQKKRVAAVAERMNDFIRLVRRLEDEVSGKDRTVKDACALARQEAEALGGILESESEALREKGGAAAFLSREWKRLAAGISAA